MMSPCARKHISNICNIIEEQNKKNSELIKNIENTNYQKLKKNLFTDSEQVQLAAIIPPSFLNEFKERFEIVENERYDLMDKLQKNKNKINGRSEDIQIKLNYTELKRKEQKLQWVDMNANFSKKNVELNNLKNEIKKVNKEFRNWSRLLKLKNNENQKLNDVTLDTKESLDLNEKIKEETLDDKIKKGDLSFVSYQSENEKKYENDNKSNVKSFNKIEKLLDKEKRFLKGYQINHKIENEFPKFNWPKLITNGDLYENDIKNLEKVNPIAFQLEKEKMELDLKQLKRKRHQNKLNYLIILRQSQKQEKLDLEKSKRELEEGTYK
jgi:hypothetical protein